MKKVLSLMLVLAMALSMFAISASAASNAKYVVSYVGCNSETYEYGTELDTASLAVGDVFAVKVDLVGAAGFRTSSVELNWNPKVLALAGYQGVEASEYAEGLMDTLVNYSGYRVGAQTRYRISEAPCAFDKANGSLLYDLMIDATYQQAFALTGNDVYVVLMFKVVGEGDANVAIKSAKINEVYGQDTMDVVTSACEVPALKIGGSDPVDWDDFTDDETADWSSGFKYVSEIADDGTQTIVESGYNGKKIVCFGKNASGAALTDKGYGIKIGNNSYAGKGAVPEAGVFAIVLIDSNADTKVGDTYYSYSIWNGTEDTVVKTGLEALIVNAAE